MNRFSRSKLAVSLMMGLAVLGFFYINATSLSDFPSGGLKMADIIDRAYPLVSCENQVIDPVDGGFISTSPTTGQDWQISRIIAVDSQTLEITGHNTNLGQVLVRQMRFLKGTVSGGWGEKSTLPGRITSVEKLNPLSGGLLNADGLKIVGDKLNANGTVNTGGVTGYIFFTGNVKVNFTGVLGSPGAYLNTFSRLLDDSFSPAKEVLFVGNRPIPRLAQNRDSIELNCYNTSYVRNTPVDPALAALIVLSLED